jgi:O-antigen biosynthesis protein WbqP
MIRFIDICISIICIIIFSPLLTVLFLFGLFDSSSPLFFQLRLGRNKKKFRIIKFRSMLINTESLPTHLIDARYVTKYGRFLRKYKLDELPQLFNVLSGSMSLVGPRPNLLNQLELTSEREMLGVYKVRPGITGLAQIKKIDMSNPKLLAKTDCKMIKNFEIFTYFKLIFSTFFKLK